MVEIFSPGEYANWIDRFGLMSRGAFDLNDGWNWKNTDVRIKVEQAIQLISPNLVYNHEPTFWTTPSSPSI